MSVAIIIPTLGRPHILEEQVEHLLNTAGCLVNIHFVVDAEDAESIDVIIGIRKHRPMVHMITTRENGVGRCFEFGYQNTTEDFVLTVGDDMRFPQDWVKTALEEIGDKGVLAIADENSGSWCVFMVRRSYCEEHSCVNDRPNTMFNVDYDRIADSEMVFTMQARGHLAYASFFVDHRNPLFYGSKKLAEDGKTVETQFSQYLIRDLAIPYSNVTVDIISNKETGVGNLLLIKIVPKNPMWVNEFRYTPYSEEATQKDAEILKKRAYMWGGRLHHEIVPRIEGVKNESGT